MLIKENHFKGIVVSDLHLMTERTDFQLYENDFLKSCESKDITVLNGDIIDFKWSKYPNFEDTVEHALAFLRKTLETNGKLVYILGNHDRINKYYTHLDEFAKNNNGFEWNAAGMKINEHLFIHGDLPGKYETLTDRKPKYVQKVKGKTANKIYSSITSTKLLSPLSLYNSASRTTGKIHQAIDEVYPDIKYVYSGHTHTPYSEFEHKGRIYSNTGSAVRNMKYNPVEFET